MVVNSVFIAKSAGSLRSVVTEESRADLTCQYSGVMARRLAALMRAIAPSGSLLIRRSLLMVGAHKAGFLNINTDRYFIQAPSLRITRRSRATRRRRDATCTAYSVPTAREITSGAMLLPAALRVLTNTQGNAAQQTQTVVTRSWPAGLPSPMSAQVNPLWTSASQAQSSGCTLTSREGLNKVPSITSRTTQHMTGRALRSRLSGRRVLCRAPTLGLRCTRRSSKGPSGRC